MDGRHNPDVDPAEGGVAADVGAAPAVHDDLGRVEPGVAILLDQPGASHVGLGDGLDVQAGPGQRGEGREVVADVVVVVVRQGDQHGVRVLALDVGGQAVGAGVFGRLLDAEGVPAAVAPEPGVDVDHVAEIRRGQLHDTGAAPPRYRSSLGHGTSSAARKLSQLGPTMDRSQAAVN